MNRYGHNCCHPQKRKPKQKCSNKTLGTLMVLLGAVTIMAFCLPLKCWVLILSFILAYCGVLLIKK